jgi:hypothetical protein
MSENDSKQRAEKPAPTRRAALGAMAAASAMVASGATRTAQAESTRKTFVLVHGTWHGGWCWRRVADALESKGHKVYAESLTGLGDRSHLLTRDVNLTTHVNDVVNLVKWDDLKDIVLVGHSSAGFVITAPMRRSHARPTFGPRASTARCSTRPWQKQNRCPAGKPMRCRRATTSWSTCRTGWWKSCLRWRNNFYHSTTWAFGLACHRIPSCEPKPPIKKTATEETMVDRRTFTTLLVGGHRRARGIVRAELQGQECVLCERRAAADALQRRRR